MIKRICAIIVVLILFILCYECNNNELLNHVKAISDIDYNYKCVANNEKVVMKNIGQYESILNALSVVVGNEKYFCDRVIIEGYTNKINKYVVINGQKVNIQISITLDSIVLGSPLIIGSF